jgi:hypothetical protein
MLIYLCQDCGEPKNLQCDLCHPHCYFRCAGPLAIYLRRWYLSGPTGPLRLQGWQSQSLSVCEAHVAGLGQRVGHGPWQESWEPVRPQTGE